MDHEAVEFAERILAAYEPGESPDEALVAADYFLERGATRLAASALDRAFGLCPTDTFLAARRCELLDSMAVVEQGIVFRYIPGGTFLMGSDLGEPDERPAHPVRLGDYWMSETCVTWAAYCHFLGWSPPPEGFPREPAFAEHPERFMILQCNKIRLQYCESETRQALDWHAHQPSAEWRTGAGAVATSQELFGSVPRAHPDRPWQYDEKPLVAVSWRDAAELGNRLSSLRIQYALPSEAQWEKAARGGRIGQLYSWGSEPPTSSRCDFDHFGDFHIRPPRSLPPNDYGLFGMCGGVWEWTADEYDALAYHTAAPRAERGDRAHVLRGGSWSDCAEAVTVSFRMARTGRGEGLCPNVGFRLVRTDLDPLAPPPAAAATQAPGEPPELSAAPLSHPPRGMLERILGRFRRGNK